MKKVLLFVLSLFCTIAAEAQACKPQVKITNSTSCTVYYTMTAALGCSPGPSSPTVTYAIPAGGVHTRTIANTTYTGPTPAANANFTQIAVLGNPGGSCGSGVISAPSGVLTSSFNNACCPGPATIIDWIPSTATATLALVNIHY